MTEPDVAIPKMSQILTRDDFSFLAITFDGCVGLTRDLDHSKALVEAHLFRGVSSQSEHFPKIAFLAKNSQTETAHPPPLVGPGQGRGTGHMGG